MAADAGIQADAVDDHLGVEALGLGVGIQLIEITDAHGQVGVGKELDGLGLGQVGEQDRDILGRLAGAGLLLAGPLQQQVREHLRLVPLVIGAADHDAAGVEVVIEGLGLAQKFRRKDDIADPVFFPDGLGVADRDRGLDDHEDLRIDLEGPLDGILDSAGVKEVVDIVIVGRRGDDDQVRGPVGRRLVGRRVEVQGPFSGPRLLKKALDLIVLDGTDELIELVRLLFRGGDCRHLVLLGQKHRERKAHISDASNCNLHKNLLLKALCIQSFRHRSSACYRI